MKMVIAVIRPFKLDEVREILSQIGVSGLTAMEVKGYGRQGGHTEIYRGAEYNTNLVPKVRIEVVCTASMSEQVVEAISSIARTDAIGDGKIFVLELADAVRIRTGERNDLAI